MSSPSSTQVVLSEAEVQEREENIQRVMNGLAGVADELKDECERINECEDESTGVPETKSDPVESSEDLPEEEPTYPHEEEMLNILMKTVSYLDHHHLLNHPIFVNLVAEAVLRKNGFDPTIRVGYLRKPDAPTWVHPYVWVETFLDGHQDITDLVSFPDRSKYIYLLGKSIGFGPESLKCTYHRSPPENTKVLTEGVPPIAQIRKAVANIDEFLHRSGETVRKVYQEILDNAQLSKK